jgi:hypothetical protein
MATVRSVILKHHRKEDGTYNIKIRITHNKSCAFLSTHHFVSDDQVSSDFKLIDPTIYSLLNKTLRVYRAAISKLNNTLDFYSAKDLKNYLKDIGKDVDFIKFSKDHISDLYNAGRKGSADTLKTVMLSLIDYFNRHSVSALEITEKELIRYEKYLRKERQITRLNKDRLVTRKVKGMGDAGIHNHMRDLRILFKAAMKHYNNHQFDDIKIPHCPFENYKIVEAPITKKRNLKLEQIKMIRNLEPAPESREELGKDMFMLSFYLCGMNAVDIYNLSPENIIDGRIEYNRSKTKSRRKDKAFISVKLVKDAEFILRKYIGKLNLRYANFENFDRAINIGLKQLLADTDLPNVTLYWARHSFGNLARNKCRISKDDVALALNHIDSYHKTTDIYLEKDWKIVDDVQKSVLNKLNKDLKKEEANKKDECERELNTDFSCDLLFSSEQKYENINL